MYDPYVTFSTLDCSELSQVSYLLSKDALVDSLSYFFPLPPDFRSPLLTNGDIFNFLQRSWESLTDEALESYPKSGNLLLGLPAGETSIGSSATESGHGGLSMLMLTLTQGVTNTLHAGTW